MHRGVDNLDFLFDAAHIGSKEAIGELLERYRPFLRKRVRPHMNVVLSTKVGEADVVQETVAAAFRAFPAFRGHTEGEMKAWLLRILEHRVQDLGEYFHRRKRDVTRETRLTETIAGKLTSPQSENEQEKRVFEQEREQALHQAYVCLPSDYQRVIQLYFYEARTFEDVAQIMVRSIAAVRKLWLRAVRRWAKEMHFPED